MKTEHLIEEAGDLVLDLCEPQRSPEQIAQSVARFLDAIVPLDVLIPGPVGLAAEQIDQIAFDRIVTHLMRVFHADPEKKAERRHRRAKRRKERQARRAKERQEQRNGPGSSE